MLSADIKSKVLLACIGLVVVSCFVWIEGSEESQPPTLTDADWSRINLSAVIALRSTSLKVLLGHKAMMLENGMKPEEVEALLSIDEVQIEKSDNLVVNKDGGRNIRANPVEFRHSDPIRTIFNIRDDVRGHALYHL